MNNLRLSLLIMQLLVMPVSELAHDQSCVAPSNQNSPPVTSPQPEWSKRIQQEEALLNQKWKERRKLVNRMGNKADSAPQAKIDKLDWELKLISINIRNLIEVGDARNYVIISGDTGKPRILYVSNPSYTEKALKKKIEGQVIFMVEFDRSGSITDIRFIQKLEPDLDENAFEAAKKILFFPKVQAGHFVTCQTKVEVTFSLVGVGVSL